MVEQPQPNIFQVKGKKKGLGYLKSLNSIKDFDVENTKVKPLVQKLMQKGGPLKLPTSVDFRGTMTPVRDQGSLGSCTAFSACAMVEYFHLLKERKYTELSTLFTYKATRNLMKVKGDTGAYMRSVMGSIALFGVPPEEYWVYDGREESQNTNFEVEPPGFCYAFASNYQAVRYLRIDKPNLPGSYTTNLLKQFMAKKYPVIFGFTCYDSLYQSNENGGLVPFPNFNENIVGGHAVTLCGYDDNKLIRNAWSTNETTTTGAFLFKNSWGTEWGDKGYGWIPYKFFDDKLADDCWTIISQEFIDHIPFQE